MRKLLERLGLIKEIIFELSISKEDFIDILKYNTDQDKFASFFTDIFSTKHTKYKGTINSDNFILKCKTNLLQPSLNYPIIYGSINQTSNGTIIKSTIKGIDKTSSYYFVSMYLFTILLFLWWTIGVANDITDIVVFSTFLLIVIGTISVIEYIRIKTGISKVTKMLTADFNKMTRKTNVK